MYLLVISWSTLGSKTNDQPSHREMLTMALMLATPGVDLGGAGKWLAIKVGFSIPAYLTFPFSPLIFEWSPLALIAIDNKEVYLIAASGSTSFVPYIFVAVMRMLLLDPIAFNFGDSLVANRDDARVFDEKMEMSALSLVSGSKKTGALAFLYLRGGTFFAIALLIRLGVSKRAVWLHNIAASIIYAGGIYYLGVALRSPITNVLSYLGQHPLVIVALVDTLSLLVTIRGERNRSRLIIRTE